MKQKWRHAHDPIAWKATLAQPQCWKVPLPSPPQKKRYYFDDEVILTLMLTNTNDRARSPKFCPELPQLQGAANWKI